jgi:hypothetical protein
MSVREYSARQEELYSKRQRALIIGGGYAGGKIHCGGACCICESAWARPAARTSGGSARNMAV